MGTGETNKSLSTEEKLKDTSTPRRFPSIYTSRSPSRICTKFLLLPSLKLIFKSKKKLKSLLLNWKLNMVPKLELLLLDSENSTTHNSMDGTKDRILQENLRNILRYQGYQKRICQL